VILALLLLLAQVPAFDESFRAGLVALQRNDLKAAEENLQAAAALAPGNARVWVALARTWWRLDQNGKAADAAAKAEKLGGSDAIVLRGLAIFYADLGQTLKAADAQARFAALAPNDAEARDKAESLYFAAVEPLLQQQKFAEAIEILRRATSRIQKSAQLELALGVAYYGLRRFDDAAAAFLRTIAIAPEIDQPYMFLGRFLGQVPDRLPELTRQFEQFEKANPSKPAGYVLHAKALDAQGIEPEKARKLLETAIALDDRDAPAHFELGVVLERDRQYTEAVREFTRAAELDPKDSATHYRLSRIYDRLGRPEDARRERELHAKLVADEPAGQRP
jgi:tetratricopeptide (TPR) repeat protein